METKIVKTRHSDVYSDVLNRHKKGRCFYLECCSLNVEDTLYRLQGIEIYIAHLLNVCKPYKSKRPDNYYDYYYLCTIKNKMLMNWMCYLLIYCVYLFHNFPIFI